ncbi:MAG: ABC transporter permease [Desulfobacterales bacterium]|nr:ABC transporter permease [Desulfobacterales bacterium]
MIPFLIRRLAGLVFLLLILTILVFSLSRALPGDVAAMYVGQRAKAEQIEKARIELGLNKPIHIQYFRYMERIFKGDLGVSFRTHRPVIDDLAKKLPMSLEVVMYALLIAVLLGLPMGVVAALKRDTWIDLSVNLISSAAVSLPIFFLALLLQLIFFNWLGWLPLQGRLSTMMEFMDPVPAVTQLALVDAVLDGNFQFLADLAWHMVLPVVSLASIPFGLVARLTRSSLLDVMQSDYILAARAAGIRERVLFFRYGLRNALSPVLSVMGLSLALMLLNTFYVEQIFNYPGIGYYALASIFNLDYPVLVAITLVLGSVYVLSNTIIDVLRRWADPRIV